MADQALFNLLFNFFAKSLNMEDQDLFLYGILLYENKHVAGDEDRFISLFSKSVLFKPVNSQDVYWKTLLCFLSIHSIRTMHLDSIKRAAGVRYSCLGLKPTRNIIYLDQADNYLGNSAEKFEYIFSLHVISSITSVENNAEEYRALSRTIKQESQFLMELATGEIF